MGIVILGFFIIYAAIAGLFIHLLTLGVRNLWFKIPIIVVLAAGSILFLVGDILHGRWWLNHACEAEGGLQIYHKIALGPEYWREDGSPRFIKNTGTARERGDFDSEVLDNRIIKERKTYHYREYPKIKVSRTSMIDQSNGRILGEFTVLFYYGGGLAFMFGEFGGESCPEFRGMYTRLFTEIFVKE